jgi:hypothetical protein
MKKTEEHSNITDKIPTLPSLLNYHQIDETKIVETWAQIYSGQNSGFDLLNRMIPKLTGGMPLLVSVKIKSINNLLIKLNQIAQVHFILKNNRLNNPKQEDNLIQQANYQLGMIGKDILIYMDWETEYFENVYVGCALNDGPNELWQTVLNILDEEKLTENSSCGSVNLMYLDDEFGLFTKAIKLKYNEVSPIDLNLHYNDGMPEFNEHVLSKLKEEPSKGIVFLHGKPGTGKTTYIRYLINQLEKKMILVPSEMIPQLATPQFMNFILKNQNSIMIIEDAESILESRENVRNNIISNMLNLTDGLLSDCLGIQFICTFNTAILKIDEAFFRPGRLIGTWEFKELSSSKVAALAKKEDLNIPDIKAMTLAEIYNHLPKEFSEVNRVKNKVGY